METFYQIALTGQLTMPAVPIESDVCTRCDGSGEIVGYEWARCPCDDPEYCPTCNGDGEIQVSRLTACDACRGEGTREMQLAVLEARALDKKIAKRYGTHKPESIADWWQK